MYLILIYDILADDKGARVSRNTLKICRKYLSHIQKSVFEGNLTKLQFMKLKSELEKYIRKEKDSVIIFISRSEKWMDKEYIGVIEDKTSNFF